MPRQGRSFATRLIWLAALTSGLAVSMSTVTFRGMEWVGVKETALSDATYIAETLSAACATDLAFNDQSAVSRLASYASSNANVMGSYIYKEGRVFARYERSGQLRPPLPDPSEDGQRWDGELLYYNAPISQGGKRIGTLCVAYDAGPLYDQVRQNLGVSLVIGVAALLIAMLLARRLQRGIIGPMAELSSAAQEVSRTQDYSLRATGSDRDDELGRLTAEFNRMLERIEGREAELRAAQQALAYSEERARKVVDTALDAVVTMNSQGVVTGWNSQAERMFGWALTEAVGRAMDALIIPDRYREHHRRGLEVYLGTGRGAVLNRRIEVTALRRDGSEFPVELAITPIVLEGMTHFSAFVRDITDRRQAVEALNRERLLLRTLTDTIPDSIYIKDRECRFMMNNPSHMRAVGAASQDAMLGKTDFDFFPPELAERYHADDQWVIREGKPLLHLEEPVVDVGGRRRWMAVSKVPIRDTSGTVGGLIGISRDITDLHEALERLEATNTELRGKNQEMEQFVYTVSHDLKSPIVTCLGFLGLIRQEIQQGRWEEIVGPLERVERAISRMHDSIEDLLELSRIGRVRHEPQAIDMDDLLRQITEELGTRFRERGVELKVEAGLPSVTGDRARVLEVFENLLTNALKYGATGEHARVEVGGARVDGEQRFYVRDNGEGIAPQYHQKVFGLFQRLDNKKEGTGVGLTIVQRIMEVHGGRAWVESEVGRGATFWVAFPGPPPP